MKNTGLNGYVFDFSADYNTFGIGDVIDTHNYLIEKDSIK